MTSADRQRTGTTGRRRPRVVIVGGGFGGLQAARGLRRADLDVLLVDRTNHHLFQPLLYQVATALLPPGDIAPALRKVLARQKNAQVLLGEADAIDPGAHTVGVTTADGVHRDVGYDYLVVSVGSEPQYFGHEEWAASAPPMKTLQQAVGLRNRLLTAFEAAAAATDPATRAAWLTFVVVGGGPTGVEMAGQLAALARRTIRKQFHTLDVTELRIVLADGADVILGTFPATLQHHTRQRLTRLGVEVLLAHLATEVTPRGVTLSTRRAASRNDADTEPEDGPQQLLTRIEARTVLWAAGVEPAPFTGQVARATGADTDHSGRILVEKDCTVNGHPEIFVIGDMANLDDLPGVAAPAVQEGRYVAELIRHRLGDRKDPGLFHYTDLGAMATIAPFDAIADIRGIRLRGLVGKAAWAGLHVALLVGWGNRAAVLANWVATVFTGSRRQQIILREPESPDTAL